MVGQQALYFIDRYTRAGGGAFARVRVLVTARWKLGPLSYYVSVFRIGRKPKVPSTFHLGLRSEAWVTGRPVVLSVFGSVIGLVIGLVIAGMSLMFGG